MGGKILSRSLTRRLSVAGAVMMLMTGATLAAAAPAQAVPNMVFVSATSVSNSNLGKVQSASCPAGRRVLGGGGFVLNGGTEVTINSMRPVIGLSGDSFEVVASAVPRTDGTSYRGSWAVLAYAVCGSAPAGLEYITATTSSEFGVSRSVIASCSAGKKLIGLGGAVAPDFGFVMLDEVAPSATLTAVRVTAFQSEVPLPFAWRVTATAICANPIPGLTLVQGISSLNSLDKIVDVSCPAGTKVHGLGHDLAGANGQAGVEALFPGQPLTSIRLRAVEDPNGLSANWQARAYAICAA